MNQFPYQGHSMSQFADRETSRSRLAQIGYRTNAQLLQEISAPPPELAWLKKDGETHLQQGPWHPAGGLFGAGQLGQSWQPGVPQFSAQPLTGLLGAGGQRPAVTHRPANTGLLGGWWA